MRRSARQRDVSTPHFQVPFQFGGVQGGAFMNEQDTVEDIQDCVKAILAFPIDSLDSQPDFGRPDILFEEFSGQIPEEIRSAIVEWEERADTDIEGGIRLEDPFVWDLLLKIGKKRA